MISFGILLALGAMLCWGLGDFLIQKATRVVGVVRALFIITACGSIILFPFIYKDFFSLPYAWAVLLLAGVGMLLASLLDFAALKQQDLSIVQPAFGVEMPLTVLLGVVLAHEVLSGLALFAILLIFLGVTLVGVDWSQKRVTILKKGVALALLGATAMALTNFFTGLSAQQTNPLFAMWVIHSFVALFTGAYLLLRSEFSQTLKDVLRYPRILLSQAVIDNFAWVLYASAMTYLPIGVTTAYTESYIAVSVLLGIIINKERVHRLQILGIIGVVVGLITLGLLA